MKVLVAKQNNDGKWQKVGVYSVRKNGTMALPVKYNGQLDGYFIRCGAKHLTEELAANWIDFQYGTSPAYRISRI